MLTTKAVRDLEVKAQDYVAWDRPGFGVRVRPSGVKSYVLMYRAKDGPLRKMTLAKVDDLPLSKAREEAERFLAKAKLGKDPARERTEKRRSPTVAALADRWIERDGIAEKTRREYRRQLDAEILPRIGKKKLASLSQADVERVYFAILDSGRAPLASSVVKTVSSLLSWGVDRREIQTNVAAGVKKAAGAGVDRRTLTEDEASRLLVVLDEIRDRRHDSKIAAHNARVAAAFRLTLLVGIRPSDAYNLRWGMIDWDANLIRFNPEDQKADHDMPGYLGSAAVRLLRELENEKADPKYVFPSRRVEGEPISDPRKLWGQIRKRAKLRTDLNPKHLRKTHGTLALNWDQPMAVVSKGIRHASTKTTEKHYAFMGEKRVADAEEIIQRKIAALGNKPAEVRPIR
jgi:integrase